MLACVGESESSLMDVIVGDRDSGIGYVNFRYDTDYFAAVKTSHTRRAHLAYGGFTAAQGYSPQDASDQLVEKLRRGARGAASESRSDAKRKEFFSSLLALPIPLPLARHRRGHRSIHLVERGIARARIGSHLFRSHEVRALPRRLPGTSLQPFSGRTWWDRRRPTERHRPEQLVVRGSRSPRPPRHM